MLSLVVGFLRYVSPRLWLKLLPILVARSYKSYRYMTEEWLPDNWLTVSTMHFQDAYNFDVDRVKHCCLHYGVPDKNGKARLIPFCPMNIIHRQAIEREFSKPRKKRASRSTAKTRAAATTGRSR